MKYAEASRLKLNRLWSIGSPGQGQAMTAEFWGASVANART